jgi:hypothetical protein
MNKMAKKGYQTAKSLTGISKLGNTFSLINYCKKHVESQWGMISS